jgi:hypothetical protein
LANVTWLFLWHYEFFTMAMVAIAALLILLIAVYLRLGIGRTSVSTSERWLVRVPFSVYLGWVTVATIANASSWLDYVNWGGWGISPEIWTVIMLVAATGITGAVTLTRGDIAYGLVIVWAFVGIAVKHAGTPMVSTAVWIATAAVAIITVLGAWLHHQQQHQPSSLAS